MKSCRYPVRNQFNLHLQRFWPSKKACLLMKNRFLLNQKPWSVRKDRFYPTKNYFNLPNAVITQKETIFTSEKPTLPIKKPSLLLVYSLKYQISLLMGFRFHFPRRLFLLDQINKSIAFEKIWHWPIKS